MPFGLGEPEKGGGRTLVNSQVSDFNAAGDNAG